MKKVFLLLTLVFVSVVLNNCCAPSFTTYEPISENKKITPFLFSEFVAAKKYRGNSVKGYTKRGTTLSLNGNSIFLFKPFCFSPLDFIFDSSHERNWDKTNMELIEWFKAMGVPLKEYVER